MKLDPTYFRYITKEEFRVLTAIEMGMRNHDLVPVPLIESIAKITRGGTFKILSSLLRNKLVSHENKQYDGYRVSYHGYDFLALRTLVTRGTIVSVGRRVGVGKESDVHCAQGPNGEVYALKLHRLGRISFRAIKQKRDYLQHRQHASWQYMARLAAMKEFAYMKALKDEGFPVPTPIDQNRHCVVMTFIEATPLMRVRELKSPSAVLERLMRMIVRLARAGLVHGDFNEFNLMIDDNEKVTLIDFPQMIHLSHVNAEEQFDRDVRSTCDFFRRRLDVDVVEFPTFKEVMYEVHKDGAGPLSNIAVEGLSKQDNDMLVDGLSKHEKGKRKASEGSDDEGDDDDDDSEDEEGEEEAEEADAAADSAVDTVKKADGEVEDLTQLVPDEGKDALGDAKEDEEQTAAAATSSAAPGGYNAADAPVAPERKEGEAAEEEKEDDEEGSGSDVSEGPGQVNINSGKKIRRRTTGKEARKNLQKQQKKAPAKANNQKVTANRKAKHEIKEYFS